MTGTVTGPVSAGRHRPPEASVAAAAICVLGICAAMSLTEPGASPSNSAGANATATSDFVTTMLAALGAGLMSIVSPILPAVLTAAVVLLGIRLILVPFPTPRRRRLGWPGGGLRGGLVLRFVRFVMHLVLAALRGLLLLLRVLVREVASQRASVSFTVTDLGGRPRHVRLLHGAPGLGHGDLITVRGPHLGGVVHASSVRVSATGLMLHRQVGAALPLTVVLAACAAAATVGRVAS